MRESHSRDGEHLAHLAWEDDSAAARTGQVAPGPARYLRVAIFVARIAVPVGTICVMLQRRHGS